MKKTDFDFDYYAVLGVPSTASTAELKQQYHLLVKLYHPDTNPGEEEECNERMRLVNEAFRVLSNPKERARYDVYRSEEEAYDDPQPRHRSDPESYPLPTYRPMPRRERKPFEPTPRKNVRESVIAGSAGGVLVLGVVLAVYNLVAPQLSKPAQPQAPAVQAPVAGLPPPVTVERDGSTTHLIVDAKIDKPRVVKTLAPETTNVAPVRHTHPRIEPERHTHPRTATEPRVHPRVAHHSHAVRFRDLSPAQKDARASAIAERIERSKRAAAFHDVFR